jgi:hypothetical protein
MDLCIECGIRQRSTAYSLTGSEMCDPCIAAELTAFQYHTGGNQMRLSNNNFFHGVFAIEVVPADNGWSILLRDEAGDDLVFIKAIGPTRPALVIGDEPEEPIEVKAIHEEAAA